MFGSKFNKSVVALALASVALATGCGKKDANSANQAGTGGSGYKNTGGGGNYGGCTPITQRLSFSAPQAQIGISRVTAAQTTLSGGSPGPFQSQQGAMGFVSMNINRGNNNNGGYNTGPVGASGVFQAGPSLVANARAYAAYAYGSGGGGYNGGGYNNGGNNNNGGYNYGYNQDPCISAFAFDFIVGAGYVYGQVWIQLSAPGYNGQMMNLGTYPYPIIIN